MSSGSPEHWITSSRVLLGSEAGGFRVVPAWIGIKGQSICTVIETSPGPPVPADIADYGDAIIAPAFVNPHTHLAMSFMRGLFSDFSRDGEAIRNLFFSIESQLSGADVRAFTRMGAYESILAGVGMVWDHFYFGSAIADGLKDVGLPGVVAPTLQDVHGPAVPRWPEELEATHHIATGAQYSAAGVFAALGPHATDSVSVRLWNEIVQCSQATELPLHLHLAQTPGEVDRVRDAHGTRPALLLQRVGVLDLRASVLMAHGIFMSTADARLVTGGSGILIFCPSSQFQFAVPARIDRWCDVRVPFVVGTDCGNCNDGLGIQKELRTVAGFRTLECAFGAAQEAFVERGGSLESGVLAAERERLTHTRALLAKEDYLFELITRTPGGLHSKFRVGAISEGTLANLAVWDTRHPAFWPSTDPLRSLTFGDINHALKQLYLLGRAVADRGTVVESILSSVEFAEARREAEMRLSSLLRRVGAHP